MSADYFKCLEADMLKNNMDHDIAEAGDTVWMTIGIEAIDADFIEAWPRYVTEHIQDLLHTGLERMPAERPSGN